MRELGLNKEISIIITTFKNSNTKQLKWDNTKLDTSINKLR